MEVSGELQAPAVNSGLRAYRAVNTLHFGYKNQSLNVL
jgi:hypothetical protein